jgi:hypothetical protein
VACSRKRSHTTQKLGPAPCRGLQLQLLSSPTHVHFGKVVNKACFFYGKGLPRRHSKLIIQNVPMQSIQGQWFVTTLWLRSSLRNPKASLVLLAHAYNPSYSGGRDQEVPG